MIITWDVDPILAPGPMPLRYYGVCIASAIVGGFLLWRWQQLRAGKSEQLAASGLAFAVPAIVLGARLGHCLFYDPRYCFGSCGNFISVWKGGLASHGALVGMLVAMALHAWCYRLSYVDSLDRLSFGACFAVIGVRLGNLMNSEIVGRVTHGSFGVRFPRFDGVSAMLAPPRHPVQVYEMLIGLVALSSVWLVDRARGEARPRGLFAALFLSIYFGGRLLAERFKEYEGLAPHGSWMTTGQWLSLFPAACGLVWLVRIGWRERRR